MPAGREPLAVVGQRAGRRTELGVAGRGEDAGRGAAGLSAIVNMVPLARTVDPNQMYLAYGMCSQHQLAVDGHALFGSGLMAQINVTNAYVGSLAWSNFSPHLAAAIRACGGRVQHADRLHADGMGVFRRWLMLGLYSNWRSPGS
jgi:hypothetical protein